MDYGAHLPLMVLDGRSWTLERLLAYTQTAEDVGFQAVSANDHLVFARPWLDGLTALAAVLSRTGKITLATTVALPVVRGPVALAKSLAAIDPLSGGRLIVGVGPGSSASDHAAVESSLRGTLEAPGRSRAGVARPLARRGSTFQGRVLLH